MPEHAPEGIAETERTDPPAEVEGTEEPNTDETVGLVWTPDTLWWYLEMVAVMELAYVLNSATTVPYSEPGMWCWPNFLHDVNC